MTWIWVLTVLSFPAVALRTESRQHTLESFIPLSIDDLLSFHRIISDTFKIFLTYKSIYLFFENVWRLELKVVTEAGVLTCSLKLKSTPGIPQLWLSASPPFETSQFSVLTSRPKQLKINIFFMRTILRYSNNFCLKYLFYDSLNMNQDILLKSEK